MTRTEIDDENFILPMREADAEECRRQGYEPQEALSESIRESLKSIAVFSDGELLGVWGYRPHTILGSTVNAWFLSTPAIENHRIAAARESKRVISFLLTLYPQIVVRVDKDYTLSINWLSWLGFEVSVKEGIFLDMILRRNQWDS